MRFFGWYENETSVFIAMEYVVGGDLAGLVLQGDIPECDVKTITRQVLEGLDIMHKSNFCHRDLKPQVRVPPPPDLNDIFLLSIVLR